MKKKKAELGFEDQAEGLSNPAGRFKHKEKTSAGTMAKRERMGESHAVGLYKASLFILVLTVPSPCVHFISSYTPHQPSSARSLAFISFKVW